MKATTPYPHKGGCSCCRKPHKVGRGAWARRCNVCGWAITGFTGPYLMDNGQLTRDRCSNGRCTLCCQSVCTEGGNTAPGHGFGTQRAAKQAAERNGPQCE